MTDTGCGHVCADGTTRGSLPGRGRDISLLGRQGRAVADFHWSVRGWVSSAPALRCHVLPRGRARGAWTGEDPAVLGLVESCTGWLSYMLTDSAHTPPVMGLALS